MDTRTFYSWAVVIVLGFLPARGKEENACMI